MKFFTSLLLIAVIIFILYAAFPHNAHGAEYMLGDSIGVGIAQTGHMKSFAKVGAPTSAIIQQIKRVPNGSDVYISSGTNDAVAGKTELKSSVDAIFLYAKQHNIKVTWIGPPCVKTSWNYKAEKLEAWMHSYIQNLGRYINLMSACSMPRAKDGIHYTANGYATLYRMIK